MRIEATHPGRHGDILWALPTVRAIAAAYGESVHLTIPTQYGSLAPLLAQQAYIASVLAREDWVVEQTAPITPRTPPTWETTRTADRIFHLGYDGWPTPTLPEDVYERCAKLGVGEGQKYGDPILPSLDLTTPWLTAPPVTEADRRAIVIGFTDEHFELKFGIVELLEPQFPDTYVLEAPGSRWTTEARPVWTFHDYETTGADSWERAAQYIAASRVFFGCCSALHVLAVGLGVPTVVMEPNPQRLNPVFWPGGQDGPQVRLVRGNDGQATWDARHCAEALRAALGK